MALRLDLVELDGFLATETTPALEVIAQPAVEPWELVDRMTRSSIDLRAVEAIEAAVDRHAELYPTLTPGQLGPLVHRQLGRVSEALGEPQPLEVRRRLVRVLGYAAGLAANLAYDTRQQARAAEFFDAAVHASHEAEDIDLAAWVAANWAIAHYTSGSWPTATALLAEAAIHARTSSGPRRLAWVLALYARSLAARGDERHAIALLDEAAELLAVASTPTRGTDFFDRPRLAGLHGTSLLWLGRLDEAVTVLSTAIEQRSAGEVKGRALLMLDLAQCRLSQNEHDEALRLAEQSLELASDSLVEPIVSKTRDLVAATRTRRGDDLPAPMSDRLAWIEAKALGAG